jgi:hypothetical protein
MIAAIIAGLLYFGVVFSLAFVLGVARTLVVAPWLGTTAAVLIEMPIVVSASFVAARHLLRRRPLSLPQRAAMGGLGFALTMASEAVLAGLIRDQSTGHWAAELFTPLGMAGLAGQLAFGAMPLLIKPTNHQTG